MHALISKSFAALQTKPCWNVHFSGLLNLSMQFGKPSLDIREPFEPTGVSDAAKRAASRRLVSVRGEWWLWLRLCYWKLTLKGEPTVRLPSSDRTIQCGISRLAGQKLQSLSVHPETGATHFLFDLGGVLECRRFEKASADELWILYKPNRYTLSVYGDGTFDHGRMTNEAVDRERHPVGGTGSEI